MNCGDHSAALKADGTFWVWGLSPPRSAKLPTPPLDGGQSGMGSHSSTDRVPPRSSPPEKRGSKMQAEMWVRFPLGNLIFSYGGDHQNPLGSRGILEAHYRDAHSLTGKAPGLKAGDTGSNPVGMIFGTTIGRELNLFCVGKSLGKTPGLHPGNTGSSPVQATIDGQVI